jgi:tRNA (guanine-N7-)-methyltransferase
LTAGEISLEVGCHLEVEGRRAEAGVGLDEAVAEGEGDALGDVGAAETAGVLVEVHPATRVAPVPTRPPRNSRLPIPGAIAGPIPGPIAGSSVMVAPGRSSDVVASSVRAYRVRVPTAERPIRSFHPRRGRVTVRQADAIERLWPTHGVDVDGRTLDLARLFGNDLPVVMEIGFGTGEATAAMASADPATNLLAVDVHTPGFGRLLQRIGVERLDNVRVASGDAVELLRDMLGPGSLAGIRIYFPDPWPKARHHKRRLVQRGFVALAVSRLAPGGELHLATDWADYADQMRAVLDAEPLLEKRFDGTEPRPSRRPMTRFERAGLAKGHAVVDLVYDRI